MVLTARQERSISASQEGRNVSRRSRTRNWAPTLCQRRIRITWGGIISFLFVYLLLSLSASVTRAPLENVNMKLPLCCSSSVDSEESSLEKVKFKAEENQKEESAASEEELGAGAPAAPPAVQEVPTHLLKQHVRKNGRRMFSDEISFWSAFPRPLELFKNLINSWTWNNS